MEASPVDRVYDDFKATMEMLRRSGDVSLQSSIDDLFKKALLLSAASWFEHLIVEGIIEVTSEYSNRSSAIVNFVRNKGLARQFHTLFNWESANAWQFFGLFGTAFARYMRTRVESDPALEMSIRAFLEIGDNRNRMAHGNYAAFSLEKTADEIFSQYQTATSFAEGFRDCLRSFCQSEASAPAVP